MFLVRRLTDPALKRLYRYIFRRVLAPIIEGDLDLTQLDVQLSSGTIELSDLGLKKDVLNAALASTPFQIVSAGLGRVKATVAYADLLTKSCQIEVDDIQIHIKSFGKPVAKASPASDKSTTEQSGRQRLREHLLDETAREGIEILATWVDQVFSKVSLKVKHVDIIVSSAFEDEVRLRLHVPSCELRDETPGTTSTTGSGQDSEATPTRPAGSSNPFVHKVFEFSGLRVGVVQQLRPRGRSHLGSGHTTGSGLSSGLSTASPQSAESPQQRPHSHSIDSTFSSASIPAGSATGTGTATGYSVPFVELDADPTAYVRLKISKDRVSLAHALGTMTSPSTASMASPTIHLSVFVPPLALHATPHTLHLLHRFVTALSYPASLDDIQSMAVDSAARRQDGRRSSGSVLGQSPPSSPLSAVVGEEVGDGTDWDQLNQADQEALRTILAAYRSDRSSLVDDLMADHDPEGEATEGGADGKRGFFAAIADTARAYWTGEVDEDTGAGASMMQSLYASRYDDAGSEGGASSMRSSTFAGAKQVSSDLDRIVGTGGSIQSGRTGGRSSMRSHGAQSSMLRSSMFFSAQGDEEGTWGERTVGGPSDSMFHSARTLGQSEVTFDAFHDCISEHSGAFSDDDGSDNGDGAGMTTSVMASSRMADSLRRLKHGGGGAADPMRASLRRSCKSQSGLPWMRPSSPITAETPLFEIEVQIVKVTVMLLLTDRSDLTLPVIGTANDSPGAAEEEDDDATPVPAFQRVLRRAHFGGMLLDRDALDGFDALVGDNYPEGCVPIPTTADGAAQHLKLTLMQMRPSISVKPSHTAVAVTITVVEITEHFTVHPKRCWEYRATSTGDETKSSPDTASSVVLWLEPNVLGQPQVSLNLMLSSPSTTKAAQSISPAQSQSNLFPPVAIHRLNRASSDSTSQSSHHQNNNVKFLNHAHASLAPVFMAPRLDTVPYWVDMLTEAFAWSPPPHDENDTSDAGQHTPHAAAVPSVPEPAAEAEGLDPRSLLHRLARDIQQRGDSSKQSRRSPSSADSEGSVGSSPVASHMIPWQWEVEVTSVTVSLRGGLEQAIQCRVDGFRAWQQPLRYESTVPLTRSFPAGKGKEKSTKAPWMNAVLVDCSRVRVYYRHLGRESQGRTANTQSNTRGRVGSDSDDDDLLATLDRIPKHVAPVLELRAKATGAESTKKSRGGLAGGLAAEQHIAMETGLGWGNGTRAIASSQHVPPKASFLSPRDRGEGGTWAGDDVDEDVGSKTLLTWRRPSVTIIPKPHACSLDFFGVRDPQQATGGPNSAHFGYKQAWEPESVAPSAPLSGQAGHPSSSPRSQQDGEEAKAEDRELEEDIVKSAATGVAVDLSSVLVDLYRAEFHEMLDLAIALADSATATPASNPSRVDYRLAGDSMTYLRTPPRQPMPQQRPAGKKHAVTVINAAEVRLMMRMQHPSAIGASSRHDTGSKPSYTLLAHQLRLLIASSSRGSDMDRTPPLVAPSSINQPMHATRRQRVARRRERARSRSRSRSRAASQTRTADEGVPHEPRGCSRSRSRGNSGGRDYAVTASAMPASSAAGGGGGDLWLWVRCGTLACVQTPTGDRTAPFTSAGHASAGASIPADGEATIHETVVFHAAPKVLHSAAVPNQAGDQTAMFHLLFRKHSGGMDVFLNVYRLLLRHSTSFDWVMDAIDFFTPESTAAAPSQPMKNEAPSESISSSSSPEKASGKGQSKSKSMATRIRLNFFRSAVLYEPTQRHRTSRSPAPHSQASLALDIGRFEFGLDLASSVGPQMQVFRIAAQDLGLFVMPGAVAVDKSTAAAIAHYASNLVHRHRKTHKPIKSILRNPLAAAPLERANSSSSASGGEMALPLILTGYVPLTALEQDNASAAAPSDDWSLDLRQRFVAADFQSIATLGRVQVVVKVQAGRARDCDPTVAPTAVTVRCGTVRGYTCIDSLVIMTTALTEWSDEFDANQEAAAAATKRNAPAATGGLAEAPSLDDMVRASKTVYGSADGVDAEGLEGGQEKELELQPVKSKGKHSHHHHGTKHTSRGDKPDAHSLGSSPVGSGTSHRHFATHQPASEEFDLLKAIDMHAFTLKEQTDNNASHNREAEQAHGSSPVPSVHQSQVDAKRETAVAVGSTARVSEASPQPILRVSQDGMYLNGGQRANLMDAIVSDHFAVPGAAAQITADVPSESTASASLNPFDMWNDDPLSEPLPAGEPFTLDDVLSSATPTPADATNHSTAGDDTGQAALPQDSDASNSSSDSDTDEDDLWGAGNMAASVRCIAGPSQREIEVQLLDDSLPPVPAHIHTHDAASGTSAPAPASVQRSQSPSVDSAPELQPGQEQAATWYCGPPIDADLQPNRLFTSNEPSQPRVLPYYVRSPLQWELNGEYLDTTGSELAPQHNHDVAKRPPLLLQVTVSEVDVEWRVFAGHDWLPAFHDRFPHSSTLHKRSTQPAASAPVAATRGALFDPEPESAAAHHSQGGAAQLLAGLLDEYAVRAELSDDDSASAGTHPDADASEQDAIANTILRSLPKRVHKLLPRPWTSTRDTEAMLQLTVQSFGLKMETFDWRRELEHNPAEDAEKGDDGQTSPNSTANEEPRMWLLNSVMVLAARKVELGDCITASPVRRVLGALPSDPSMPIPEMAPAFRVRHDVIRARHYRSLPEHRLHVAIRPTHAYLCQENLHFLLAATSTALAMDALSEVEQRAHRASKGMQQADSDADAAEADTTTGRVVFFQLCHIEHTSFRLDYSPAAVDRSALFGGRFIELVNLIPIDGLLLDLPRVREAGLTNAAAVGRIVAAQWAHDITRNQLHKLLAGVNAALLPLRSLANITAGAANVVLLPVQDYRRTGRVRRGIVDGVAGLGRALALEAIDLTSGLLRGTGASLKHIEHAFGDSGAADDESGCGGQRPRSQDAAVRRSHFVGQPSSAGEGVMQAMRRIGQSVQSAAHTIVAVPVVEYEERGSGAAAKAVVRAVPLALLRPLRGLTEGVTLALSGIRTSVDPATARQAAVLYKQNVPGASQ